MKNERGITGLETAIILVTFVVVASLFLFIVLTAKEEFDVVMREERGPTLETIYLGLGGGWTINLNGKRSYQATRDVHCEIVGKFLRCDFPIIEE